MPQARHQAGFVLNKPILIPATEGLEDHHITRWADDLLTALEALLAKYAAFHHYLTTHARPES